MSTICLHTLLPYCRNISLGQSRALMHMRLVSLALATGKAMLRASATHISAECTSCTPSRSLRVYKTTIIICLCLQLPFKKAKYDVDINEYGLGELHGQRLTLRAEVCA